ncbi:3fbd1cbf-455c-4bd5-9a4c-82e0df57131f [Thermothielavioides terrestris]|uniref:3fbd1cbf-455c-4bd5-9a4c-82e0df57131f n=1 Tax=Thermothielavioides terrestris TaxID=2587410 RepID=A0A446BAL0_9PEZI|nr:3fbd1cbf-455c-4bd5-9a4c-82e0df57131f [Thermothielavioides terrestris]
MTSSGAAPAAPPTAAAPHSATLDDLEDEASQEEEEEDENEEGLSGLQTLFGIIAEQAEALGNMEYGANRHPPFKDDPPQLIADLPPEHIPTYTPPSQIEGPGGGKNKKTQGKRLVVAGDVHGHLAALKALLRKIGFDNNNGDHLVLAGDLVTKGPDSRGVVQLAMDLGASAVRGNQDDRVLVAARELRRASVDDQFRQVGYASDADAEADADAEEDDEAQTHIRKRAHVRKVARSLTRAQLDWLSTRPIILRIGRLPDATSPPWNANTLAVVHGGLVPGTPFEKQDPWAVMNMRSLLYPGRGKHHISKDTPKDDPDNNDENSPSTPIPTPATEAVAVPIDGRKGEPWSHAWNRYQNHLPPTAPHTVVIYGHDAKAGLQVDLEADISAYDPSSSSRRKGRKPKHSNRNDNVKGNGNGDGSPEVMEDRENEENEEQQQQRKKKEREKGKQETGLRYAFGLDSGCGHGRQLSALVVEAGPAG